MGRFAASYDTCEANPWLIVTDATAPKGVYPKVSDGVPFSARLSTAPCVKLWLTLWLPGSACAVT
jgi:hypothetical protein